jgi:hypothetical protein
LGLSEDRNSRFSYPETVHFCFAHDEKNAVPLGHQSAFCLSLNYPTCPRYAEPSPGSAVPRPADLTGEASSKSFKFSLGWIILWGLAGLLIGSLVMLVIFNFGGYTFQQDIMASSINTATPTPEARPTNTSLATPSFLDDSSTPQAVAFLATPTPPATLLPGIQNYTLSPAEADVGWVSSGQERGNHFGDSYLYVGIFEGQVYNSSFQFDLSAIPRGAPLYQASIRLTGLRDDRLAIRNDQGSNGVWMLRLLAPEIDENWRRHSYQDIFNASALLTLSPILNDRDLAVGKVNEFELSAAQIQVLEARILETDDPKVSFRLDGPLVGSNNLFAWDTGYGSQSRGEKVVLSVSVGQPPATPPPYDYVVVTSTPTPENAVTAAAIVAQITSEAALFGTATPPPPNLATATPIPDYLVFVPTPTPENTATAQYLEVLATAQAQTTGTATPIPADAVTATPVPTGPPLPTATATPTTTPSPTLASFVLITDTPTPQTIFEAATRSALATAQTEQYGPPTPLPTHWMTPIVVTHTPTPANAATAQLLTQLATAIAATTGTPIPVPPNMVTATPTPVYEKLPLLFTPTPSGSPTPTPDAVPSVLVGKVLFRSDREGPETGFIYVFDPATGELGRLTNDWPYRVARERNAYSANKIYKTYNKQLLWTNVEVERKDGSSFQQPTTVFAIHFYDYEYNVEQQVSYFGSGFTWDPVWSPTSDQITFVSNSSGDDEIWVINRDGSNALQLTSDNQEYNAREIGKDTFIPEMNGYPTWSPDGSKIVFWSNRTGNRQLWIMNADGSDQQLLMGWDNWTPYNDWDPVWVKYADPAPPGN